jgi:hypothetical protein
VEAGRKNPKKKPTKEQSW